MTAPLVSVIIPTYNRATTIIRCLDSVFKQTYLPIEVIVVDDGSTDRTVEAIKIYGDKITLICQPNRGPSAARNAGVTTSKGDIIAFLDSDDTWMPEKIERQVKLMEQAGAAVPCCVCNAKILSENGTSINSFEVSNVESDLAEGYWLNPTPIIATRFLLFNQVVAIRRVAFDSIGGFKESMRLLEDHDLAFRLSLLGPWAFLSETLVEKYNDSNGVGVLAMKDATIHLNAWVTAVQGFLGQSVESGGDIERLILRSVKDGTNKLLALKMLESGGVLNWGIAQLFIVWLRFMGAIRRRHASWPRVRSVATLAP